MDLALNRFKQWLFLRVERWLSGYPEYYCSGILPAVAGGNPLKKNYIYWETIARVLENKPFLNELDERIEKIKARVDRELQKPMSKDNYNTIKMLSAELKGSRAMRGIMKDAQDKEIQERKK